MKQNPKELGVSMRNMRSVPYQSKSENQCVYLWFLFFFPLCQVIPFFHPFPLVPVVVVVLVLEFTGH